MSRGTWLSCLLRSLVLGQERRSERLAGELRQRWTLSLGFSLAVILLYPMDGMLMGDADPPTLEFRVGWSLEVVLLTWAWQRLGTHWEGGVHAVHGVLLGGFFMGLVLLTGGPWSPYLALTPGMPLLTALVFTESGLPTLLVGLGCMGGTLDLWLTRGRGVEAVAESLLVGSFSLLGLYVARRLREQQASRFRPERIREEAPVGGAAVRTGQAGPSTR